MNILAQISTKTLPQVAADGNTVAKIMTLVFGIVGAVCVIIILLAGFKYVLSNGEPSATAKAKNTILYAVIGLAVIASAQAVVAFTLGQL